MNTLEPTYLNFNVAFSHNGNTSIKLYSVFFGKFYKVVTPKGVPGGTAVKCTIFKEDNIVSRGYAVCNPNDKFNFEFGCKKALERALENCASLSRFKSLRTCIWKGFFHELKKKKKEI